MSDRVLITICGRAGSKGFKNKNLQLFLGEPLVYYSLSAAYLFINQIGKDIDVDICLNTDSSDLADVVFQRYPEVCYIPRAKELGEDKVPKAAVWRNCLEVMHDKGHEYSFMIDLDITSPLRRSFDILNAYRCLHSSTPDIDMVESVCNCRRNPFFNMVKEEGGVITTVINSNYTTRQQAPVVFDLNASIYVLRSIFFNRQTGNMLNQAKTFPYVMKDTAVLDIDSEEDFMFMQVVAKYLYETDEDYRIVYESIRRKSLSL